MEKKNVNKVEYLINCTLCNKLVEEPFMCQFCQKSAHFDCLKYFILDYETCPICQRQADLSNIIVNRIKGEVVIVPEPLYKKEIKIPQLDQPQPYRAPFQPQFQPQPKPQPDNNVSIQTLNQILVLTAPKEVKPSKEILPITMPSQKKHPYREDIIQTSRVIPRSPKDNKCLIHPDSILNSYCDQCNLLLCAKCIEQNSTTHKEHTIVNLQDTQSIQDELNALSKNITKSMKLLQADIDGISSSPKYSGKILPFCMEIDVATNQLKKRLRANAEDKRTKIEKKYTQLIQDATKLSEDLEFCFIYCEPNITQYLTTFSNKIQLGFDTIDSKRCFNFNRIMETDLNINEFIPPAKSASFAFILPDMNVLFQRRINIYYCDWIVTLIKTDKSDFYTVSMDMKEGEVLSKDFICNVQFHLYNKDYIDTTKEIDYTGCSDQLCYLYLFEYSSNLVGKLYTLTVTIRPKSYKAIASLLNVEFLPAQSIPLEAKGGARKKITTKKYENSLI